MLLARAILRPSRLQAACSTKQTLGRFRSLLTLAIESSCDDTSVAILEKPDTGSGHYGAHATLHFHEKITADNSIHRGIHPIVALESHSANLAILVQKALHSLPSTPQLSSQTVTLHDGSLRQKPDFISVTRGPGMRSNLACGLDTAKGLSVAWQIPLLGVHHMQAHAMTPRLASALENKNKNQDPVTPDFPFLTLLASGGHTMLLHSRSLTDHKVLVDTSDTAIGEALDKIARHILPPEILNGTTNPMYAKLLSNWVFPTPETMQTYNPPKRRGDEIHKPLNHWGWVLQPAYSETRFLKFSFTGLASRVNKLANRGDVSEEEKLALGREAMTTAFEHIGSRTTIALEDLRADGTEINTIVLSGGVAASLYLRHVMRKFLDVRGFGHVKLSFPPVELCTDNAAMIAWTGMEMYEAGYVSDLSIGPLRRWSMESTGDDSGIIGVGGWLLRQEKS